MFKTVRNKKGFTLVELMIVAVIVAVLAAVAIPLMRGTTDRAMATECESALGSIRSAMRTMYAQSGDYRIASDGSTITASATTYVKDKIASFKGRLIGTRPGDLDGTYFSEECYAITAVSQNDFTVKCTWASSVKTGSFVPKAGEVNTKKLPDGATSYSTTIDSYGLIGRAGY
jgi:prepilin-type N-terminal cleavage/methylation domain-containing protein